MRAFGLLGHLALAVFVARVVAGPETAPATRPSAETDPFSANGACYICHMTFVKEELAKTHLKHKVSCVKCHGISAKHANDEDIGATKPDIAYKRGEVNASCRKCHETHDVAPEKVLARAAERKVGAEAVCTDCHGGHRIQK